MKKILTKDIDCPWCIAKAGEDCYIQLTQEEQERRPYSDHKRDGTIHLARYKKII